MFLNDSAFIYPLIVTFSLRFEEYPHLLITRIYSVTSLTSSFTK